MSRNRPTVNVLSLLLPFHPNEWKITPHGILQHQSRLRLKVNIGKFKNFYHPLHNYPCWVLHTSHQLHARIPKNKNIWDDLISSLGIEARKKALDCINHAKQWLIEQNAEPGTWIWTPKPLFRTQPQFQNCKTNSIIPCPPHLECLNDLLKIPTNTGTILNCHDYWTISIPDSAHQQIEFLQKMQNPTSS